MQEQPLRKRRKLFYLWLSFVVLVCIGMVALYIYQTPQRVQYMWVQYGPADSASARAIVLDNECPYITIDQTNYRMHVRAGREASFPITICEFLLPRNAIEISINNQFLPVPKFYLKRILVVGNTNSPNLTEVAAKAKPDVIVHLGDYNKQTTFDWQTLETEFFSPSKSILSQAPWIFLRGTQESCRSGGDLWSRLLTSYQYQFTCLEEEDPYTINFANLQMLSLDSSLFSDYASSSMSGKRVIPQLEKVSLRPNYWLVTHRPLWGIKAMDEDLMTDASQRLPVDYERLLVKYKDGKMPTQKLIGFNDTLQQSLTPTQLDPMGMAIGGDYPYFETLSFGGVAAPQLIIGEGNSALEKEITTVLNGLLLNNKEVKNSKFAKDSGYVILEEQIQNVWKVYQYSPEGQLLFSCDYQDRQLICP